MQFLNNKWKSAAEIYTQNIIDIKQVESFRK